jgi:hypothetical protein
MEYGCNHIEQARAIAREAKNVINATHELETAAAERRP